MSKRSRPNIQPQASIAAGPSDSASRCGNSVYAAGSLLLGVHEGLHALDIDRGLKPLWLLEDPALSKFCSLIASDERLLVLNEEGELL